VVLFVNACVRAESRTKRLAAKLLDRLGEYTEVDLNEAGLEPLSGKTLKERSAYIESGNYDSPMFDYSRQFAEADKIVIAAPFWDLSFPAILKTYLENIYVSGIVSRYGVDGRPSGLCKADKMYFVTTSGGPYFPEYSYNYLKTLATEYFGIRETYLIKAEMLDVEGFDPESILLQAESEIDSMFEGR